MDSLYLKYLFWVICFFVPVLLSSQESSVKFYHVSPDDGLSQATVYDIIQDHDGYIWIGTAEGLNRYNGRSFDVFLNNPSDANSLSYDYIDKLHVDDENNLLIATLSGLNIYNRAKNNFDIVNEEGYPDKGLPNSSITDILGLSGRDFYVSTNNTLGIISRFSAKEEKYIHHTNTITNSVVNRMDKSSDNSVYMIHMNGLLTKFDETSKSFSRIDSLEKEPLCIYINDKDDVWIGIDYEGIKVIKTDGSSLRFNTSQSGEKKLSNNTVYKIIQTDNQEYWIASDGGLHQYNDEEKAMTIHRNDPGSSNSLASNFLYTVYADKDNRIWAGTAELGVSIFDPAFQTFAHVKQSNSKLNSLSNNVIWSFFDLDPEKSLVATSVGLNVFDTEKGITKVFRHNPNDPKSISNDRVWDIKNSSISKDSYWLGTSSGLNLMTLSTNQEPSFKSWEIQYSDPEVIAGNSVRCVWPDGNGKVYLGTSITGMSVFDIQTETFRNYFPSVEDPESLPGNGIRKIVKDSKNNLWVGTNNGLCKMYAEGKCINFRHDKLNDFSLSNDNIRAIHEDGSSRLWIGTDKGLNLVTYENGDSLRVHRYTVNDGLPNNRIYSIQEDELGHLWMTTNNGLSTFNPETEVFKNFTIRDGLQNNEFNQGAGMKKSDGTLFFGGINGFNYFDPNQIEADTSISKLVFSDLQIEYESIEISDDGKLKSDLNYLDEIVLDPGQRMFSLEFTSLNYSKNKDEKYAYKLEPYDTHWNFSSTNNKAMYTNIPPGKYTFYAKIINPLYNIDGKPIQKSIVIKPFYWQTNWFRFLMLGLFLLVAYILYKWRVRSLIQSKNNLEKSIMHRTLTIENQKEELSKTLATLKSTQLQVVNNEKLASIGQLTAGIAHEINNPINFIKNSAEALEYNINDLEDVFQLIYKSDRMEAEEFQKQVTELKTKLDLSYIKKETEMLISSIKTGTGRTTDIIKSLRYFSHKNSTTTQLINIEDPIESALTILNNSHKESIEIIKDYEASSFVNASPGELSQVFLNIIQNAIQSIPEKGQIWIKTKKEHNDLKISIADTGNGIPDEIKTKIFEPFFTSKRAGEGSGLGLAISNRIINEHKGRIEVTKNSPKGTIFTITLPLQK